MLAQRAAEAHERFQAAAGQAAEQPIDQLLDRGDGEAGGEDRAGHLFERPCPRDLPAGGVEAGERRGLLVGELLGVLQQRPAGVLELLGGVGGTGLA